MKLAVLAVVLSSRLVASATTLDEFGSGIPLRAASDLYEASCDIDVDLRGAVATVEVRQKLINGGTDPLAARYEFGLPNDAAINGLAVRETTGPARKALQVPTGFRTQAVDSPDILGPDPALLQATDDGNYEIIVQPIAPGHDLTLITTYTALATPRAGALRLVLPGRVAAGKLAPCRGTIRATPGPGAMITAIRPGKQFVVEDHDVAVDVDLEVAGKVPIAWTAQSQTNGQTATLVTVLGPRVKAAGARRVVLLIDSSRSMDLVGRPNVSKVIKALGNALPANAELEAILFDRTTSRVFNELRPATAQNLAAIDAALAKRPALNGSDLVKAFEAARPVIEDARGQAMVVVITDGVTGELPDQALVHALASKTSQVDVHAIVLDPAHTRSPGATALRSPVNLYGGAYIEVAAGDLDDALTAIDGWLRPSFLELGMGDQEIPNELRGGAGFSKLIVGDRAPKLELRGHGEGAFTVIPRPAPSASIAALATPVVDAQHALTVLATTGRIAGNRGAMIAGGGRYERSVAIADPQHAAAPAPSTSQLTATAIARITLERMFRDQLHPKAFACYQRALGKNPSLGGTVAFQMRMGRGEVSDVQLTRGSGDATFDACLIDAAYLMSPPLPDFTVNADDQTVANYPLTFNRRDDQPVVVLGDADSTSPIDIDAVEGGVPAVGPRRRIKPETRTPLGNLKAPKSP